MPPRRRTRDVEPDSDHAAERKKVRNRLSQQAFRQRQKAYIKELEKRAERSGTTESNRITELEEENKRLRKQLVTFANKLASARASLADLSRLVQGSLDSNEVKSIPMTEEEDIARDTNTVQETADVEDTAGLPHTQPPSEPASSSSTEHSHPSWPHSISFTDLMPVNQHCMSSGSDLTRTFGFLADAFHIPSLTQQELTGAGPDATQRTATMADLSIHSEVPGIWSFNYQMGPSAYGHAMARSQSLLGNITISNSTFSDHVSSIRVCIGEKWQNVMRNESPNSGLLKLHQAVSLMFSMFQGLTRPLAMSWYTPTRLYKYISSLIAWQLQPTREMYMRLHPRFRPTALQVSESYPSIIDWCPFAAVRDQLILTHAANPRLDEVMLDLSHSYCVEADLSTLVGTVPHPSPGYICIWDLIQAMGDTNIAPADNFDPEYPGFQLPAPTPAALFMSPDHARLVFRLLRIVDDGLTVFKLDPAFFDKYPELYSPALADVMASGMPLKPTPEALLHHARLPPPPTRMELGTLTLYRHLADWVLNVVCDAPW